MGGSEYRVVRICYLKYPVFTPPAKNNKNYEWYQQSQVFEGIVWHLVDLHVDICE